MIGLRPRFSVNNQAGVAVDVVIKARFWKATSSGLVYSTEQTVYSQTGIASSTTTWTADAGNAFDNSASLYMGADLVVTITPSASATGIVSVQMDRTTDGGTTYNTGGEGQHVVKHQFAASSTAVTKAATIDA